MKFTSGIVALNDDNEIVHFCGYKEPITQVDAQFLYDELQTDPEFGLIGTSFTLCEATQDLLDYFNDVARDVNWDSE